MILFLILGKQNLSQILILIICSFLSGSLKIFKEFLFNVSSSTNSIDCRADVAKYREKAQVSSCFLLAFLKLFLRYITVRESYSIQQISV